jgi:hypothetical protein
LLRRCAPRNDEAGDVPGHKFPQTPSHLEKSPFARPRVAGDFVASFAY